MRKRFPIIDKAVDRLGYWHGAWLIMSGALGWLWSKVPFLHDLGWAAYVLIGLFSAAVLMVLITGSLALYRWFNPLPQTVVPEDQANGVNANVVSVNPAPAFMPDGLYTGDMKISGNDFEQTHQLEMSVRGFNATGCRLAFPSTNGNIEYEAKLGKEVVASGQLLTPSILRDKRNTWENENNSEFNLVFTQPLDPKTVKVINDCLEENGTVFFKLHNLDIRAAPSDDHSNSARLPVWDGITIRKPAARFVSGRLFSAKMDVHAFSMKASNPDAQS